MHYIHLHNKSTESQEFEVHGYNNNQNVIVAPGDTKVIEAPDQTSGAIIALHDGHEGEQVEITKDGFMGNDTFDVSVIVGAGGNMTAQQMNDPSTRKGHPLFMQACNEAYRQASPQTRAALQGQVFLDQNGTVKRINAPKNSKPLEDFVRTFAEGKVYIGIGAWGNNIGDKGDNDQSSAAHGDQDILITYSDGDASPGTTRNTMADTTIHAQSLQYHERPVNPSGTPHRNGLAAEINGFQHHSNPISEIRGVSHHNGQVSDVNNFLHHIGQSHEVNNFLHRAGRVMEGNAGRVLESNAGQFLESNVDRVLGSNAGRLLESNASRFLGADAGRFLEATEGRFHEAHSNRSQEAHPGRSQGADSGQYQENDTGRYQENGSGQYQENDSGRFQENSSDRFQQDDSSRYQEAKSSRFQQANARSTSDIESTNPTSNTSGIEVMNKSNQPCTYYFFENSWNGDGTAGPTFSNPTHHITLQPHSSGFVALPSSYKGRVQRGTDIPATWGEFQLSADNDNAAHGDISLEQGCDGAAEVSSTDGSNRVNGFNVDVLADAPYAILQSKSGQGKAIKSTEGNWMAGRNQEAIDYLHGRLGTNRAYIEGGTGVDDVASHNQRLLFTFY